MSRAHRILVSEGALDDYDAADWEDDYADDYGYGESYGGGAGREEDRQYWYGNDDGQNATETADRPEAGREAAPAVSASTAPPAPPAHATSTGNEAGGGGGGSSTGPHVAAAAAPPPLPPVTRRALSDEAAALFAAALDADGGAASARAGAAGGSAGAGGSGVRHSESEAAPGTRGAAQGGVGGSTTALTSTRVRRVGRHVPLPPSLAIKIVSFLDMRDAFRLGEARRGSSAWQRAAATTRNTRLTRCAALDAGSMRVPRVASRRRNDEQSVDASGLSVQVTELSRVGRRHASGADSPAETLRAPATPGEEGGHCRCVVVPFAHRVLRESPQFNAGVLKYTRLPGPKLSRDELRAPPRRPLPTAATPAPSFVKQIRGTRGSVHVLAVGGAGSAGARLWSKFNPSSPWVCEDLPHSAVDGCRVHVANDPTDTVMATYSSRNGLVRFWSPPTEAGSDRRRRAAKRAAASQSADGRGGGGGGGGSDAVAQAPPTGEWDVRSACRDVGVRGWSVVAVDFMGGGRRVAAVTSTGEVLVYELADARVTCAVSVGDRAGSRGRALGRLVRCASAWGSRVYCGTADGSVAVVDARSGAVATAWRASTAGCEVVAVAATRRAVWMATGKKNPVVACVLPAEDFREVPPRCAGTTVRTHGSQVTVEWTVPTSVDCLVAEGHFAAAGAGVNLLAWNAATAVLLLSASIPVSFTTGWATVKSVRVRRTRCSTPTRAPPLTVDPRAL